MSKIKNIIIDPGHGGLLNGVYQTNGKMHKFPSGEIAYEGVINRTIAKQLAELVELAGYNTIYTVGPEDPTDVSLDLRVRGANIYDKDSSLYISIHNNAANTKARGFEIFTSPGKTKSDELADEIFLSVKKFYDEIKVPMRSDLSDGDYDKEERFYVLTLTKMPSVLIEGLFFDNYEDFKLLSSPIFTQKLAYHIFKGITNYIEKNG